MTVGADASASEAMHGATGGFSFLHQTTHMAGAFWATPERKVLLGLVATLVAIVGATAWMQILLNAWNEPFYNAISAKNVSGFIEQLQKFAMLAGGLLALNVTQVWLNQTIKLTMRKGLVNDLMNVWLKPERPFRFSAAGALAANPDQRMHADAHHLADLTIDLSIGLLQASLLLTAFVGVLWSQSQDMSLPLWGREVEIPGFMVWCALTYAAIASWLSWRVGKPMIRLDAERYGREGEFRFEMVRISEATEGIALYGGEARERERLDHVFGNVLAITRRQIMAMTRLTWVTAGYGWFTLVAPILAASPFYFSGDMTLGQLMLVVGAFNQVQGSLRWFVDNFPAIADWRATLLRVSSFRIALTGMDEEHGTEHRIEYVRTAAPSILIDGLGISTPAACLRFGEGPVTFQPGERIHVVGDYGAGKTLLFHTLAGLWSWGTGRIALPARDDVMFLPSRGYVAPGRLRDCVTYPRLGKSHDSQSIGEALEAVGLGRLSGQLDTEDRWDRLLSESEKHCLTFARVLLHKPLWLIVDDAFHNIDPEALVRIESLFSGPLAGAGLVYLGAGKVSEGFFTRTMALRPDDSCSIVGPNGILCSVVAPDEVRPSAVEATRNPGAAGRQLSPALT